MNWKRDIVDTVFHAYGAFGHNPILGLAFPLSWGVKWRASHHSSSLCFTLHINWCIQKPIDKLELELETRNQLINFDLELEIKYWFKNQYKLAFLSG